MFQTHAFPAGGRQIDTLGDFIRYEACSANGADETIRVRADGNDLGTFLPGDFARLPVTAKRWEVIPVTGTATGAVRIGVGSVGSSRLTGNVRVIDSGAEKTRAGGQFFGIASSGASAGVVSVVGVAAMQRTTAIKRLQIASSIAGNVAIGFSTSRGTGLGTVVTPANKLSSGSASTHRAAFGTIASSVPTAGEMPGWSAVGLLSVAANTYTDIVFAEPIVLTLDACFAAIGQSSNRDMLAIFHTEEV